MSIQIEAKGLSEEEVRNAIESALKSKDTPTEERQKRIKELYIKGLGYHIGKDKEFAIIVFQHIRKCYPDIE